MGAVRAGWLAGMVAVLLPLSGCVADGYGGGPAYGYGAPGYGYGAPGYGGTVIEFERERGRGEREWMARLKKKQRMIMTTTSLQYDLR